jgi:hypothetical protein
MTVISRPLYAPQILLTGYMRTPAGNTTYVTRRSSTNITNYVDRPGSHNITPSSDPLHIHSNDATLVFWMAVQVEFDCTGDMQSYSDLTDAQEGLNMVRGARGMIPNRYGDANILYSFTEKLPAITDCQVYHGAIVLKDIDLPARYTSRDQIIDSGRFPITAAVYREGVVGLENRVYIRLAGL